MKSEQRDARAAEMLRMRQAGVSHAEIAKFFGVSSKTVQRSLRATGQDNLPLRVRRLPPRQQRFVSALAQGVSARESALLAGYAPSTADAAGQKITGQPAVQLALQELVRAAIPMDLAVQRLREGLDANETKFFADKGLVRSQRDCVAFGERRAYLELYGKFSGLVTKDPEISVPLQVVIDL